MRRSGRQQLLPGPGRVLPEALRSGLRCSGGLLPGSGLRRSGRVLPDDLLPDQLRLQGRSVRRTSGSGLVRQASRDEGMRQHLRRSGRVLPQHLCRSGQALLPEHVRRSGDLLPDQLCRSDQLLHADVVLC